MQDESAFPLDLNQCS